MALVRTAALSLQWGVPVNFDIVHLQVPPSAEATLVSFEARLLKLGPDWLHTNSVLLVCPPPPPHPLKGCSAAAGDLPSSLLLTSVPPLGITPPTALSVCYFVLSMLQLRSRLSL